MDPCNVGPKERHITWSVQKRLHSRRSVLGLLQANVTTELDTFLVPGFSCKAHTTAQLVFSNYSFQEIQAGNTN